MSEQYTYTDAFEELQGIVSEIERGEISIDELSQKVKRAAALIEVCKAKLTATEADVNSILETLQPKAESLQEEVDGEDDLTTLAEEDPDIDEEEEQ